MMPDWKSGHFTFELVIDVPVALKTGRTAPAGINTCYLPTRTPHLRPKRRCK